MTPIEYVGEDGEPLAERILSRQYDPPVPVVADTKPEIDRKLWAERVRVARETRPEPSGRLEELTGHAGRSRKLDFRCSEEEVVRWTAAAEAEGLTTSEFIRLAADERAAQLVS